MEFGVSVLLCPQTERDGRQFVDEWVGKAVLGEVDGLDVGAANVAALDADVGELGGGVDRKLGVVFLAASGTDDAAELPLREAETAHQAATAAVTLLAEHAGRRFAIAEGTQQRRVAFQPQRCARAREFGVGLKKSKHEEFLGIGGRIDVIPALGEQVSPGIRLGGAQSVCHLGKTRWTMFFDQREKCREARDEFGRIQIFCSAISKDMFQTLVKTFLEAREVDIKAEDLSGEGMLRRQLFGAPDALLACCVGHPAIMGLAVGASKCRRPSPQSHRDTEKINKRK